MIGKSDFVTPSTGIKIMVDGIFDLHKIYSELRNWLENHEYIFQEKENTTKDKILGKEFIIIFNSEREIDDYVKFMITTKIFGLDINKVNVENKTLEKGHLEITFKAQRILDYRNKWQAKPLGNVLFFIYNNYIMKRKIEQNYELKLYNEIIELHDLAKGILDLYQ